MKKPKNKLTPEQYWKWNSYINDLAIAKLEQKLTNIRVQSLRKDVQIAQLTSSLHSSRLGEEAAKVTSAENDYKEIKEELEKELGRSLDAVTIDSVTYEIHKLED